MTNLNIVSNIPAITRIEEITQEINIKLETIQTESIQVGLLLKEAKEEFTESDKSYADFIEYCGNEFSIGKAQASKLMKVASVFAEDSRFNGVAMRVLYALATGANDDQMERAAAFAENGSLTTAICNQLLNPKPTAQVVTDKVITTPEEVLEQSKELTAVLENIPVIERTIEAPLVDAQAFTEIQELKLALEAANEIIKNFQLSKTTHNKVKDMPLLPQFKNSCAYAVLGLGKEESLKITLVKKAFRELIKCGYGEGHEAFSILTSAKDSLLESIELAKVAK